MDQASVNNKITINLTPIILDDEDINLFNTLLTNFTNFINDKIINEPFLYRLISLTNEQKKKLTMFLNDNKELNTLQINDVNFKFTALIDKIETFFKIELKIPKINNDINNDNSLENKSIEKYCTDKNDNCNERKNLAVIISDMYDLIDRIGANEQLFKSSTLFLKYLIKIYTNLMINKLNEFQDLEKYITLLNNDSNSVRYNTIYKYMNKINTNVITYLKINNFNHESNDYNKRFKVYINDDKIDNFTNEVSTPSLLRIDYVPNDLEWYDKYGNVSRRFLNNPTTRPFQINYINVIECRADLIVYEWNDKKKIDELKKKLKGYKRTIAKLHKDDILSENDFIYYNKITDLYINASSFEVVKDVLNKRRTSNDIKYSLITISEKEVDTTYSTHYKLNEVSNYAMSYYFGYFSNIFTPDKKNSEIAKNLEEFSESLIENKKGFLLGYGASGSGKTSSLIYFNKGKDDDDKNGVLIHLCNQLGERGYTNIVLYVKQFFLCDTTFDEQKCKTDVLKNPNTLKSETYNFIFDNNQWTTNAALPNTPNFEYRVNNTENHITIDVNDKSLGNFLVYLIDQDRYVKATTNNPQSSRSHALCFIEFKHNDINQNIKLVVGDLAGVENTFTNDILNIEKLINIKRDGSDSNYYDNEMVGDVFDSIKGGGNSYSVLDDSDWTQHFEIEKKGGEIDGGETDFYGSGVDYDGSDDESQNGGEGDSTNVTVDDIKKLSPLNRLIVQILFNLNEEKQTFTNAQFYKYVEITDIKDDNNVNNLINEAQNEMNENNNTEKEKQNKKTKPSKIFFPIGYFIDGSRDPDKDNIPFPFFSNYIRYNINNVVKIMMTIFRVLGKSSDFFHNHKEARDANTQNTININKTVDYILVPSGNNDYHPFFIKQEYEIFVLLSYILDKLVKNIMNTQIKNKNNSEIEKQLHNRIYIFFKETNLLNLINNNIENKNIKNNNIENKNIENNNIENNNISQLKEFLGKLTTLKKTFNTMKDVVKRRNAEGTYINDSLLKMKNALEYIFSIKNKDNVINSPNIIPVFHDLYCPTRKRCFQNANSHKQAIIEESNIIREVYEFMVDNNNNNNNNDIEKFCKEIVVCIFGVLNISKSANNPPPVPYLDINELKFVHKITENNTDITTLSNKYVETIKNLDSMFMKGGKINIIQNKVNNDISLNNNFNNHIFEKKHITEFINMVDTFNNASAIGTLEFMDKLTKLNQTDTIAFRKPKPNQLETYLKTKSKHQTKRPNQLKFKSEDYYNPDKLIAFLENDNFHNIYEKDKKIDFSKDIGHSIDYFTKKFTAAEEAKRKAAEEAKRKAAEEKEAKRKAAAEEEAKRKAEEAKRKEAAEEEAKRKAEEAKRKAKYNSSSNLNERDVLEVEDMVKYAEKHAYEKVIKESIK